MNTCDYEYKEVRGPENQPILIVGDSPSKKVENIKEVLDRNHMIYNSIIIPIKYYTEKYLNKYNYTFPECFNDEKDIFRYVNAIEDSENKKELDPERDEEKLSNLRNEIYGESKNIKYRIIICLGDFAYFAVRAVLGKYEGREKHRYGSKAKYSIKKIGEHFSANSKVDTEKEVYILPILHNSANRILDLDKLREFTPEDEREDYISYYCYIGECLGKILINDINRRDEYKEYLKRLK